MSPRRVIALLGRRDEPTDAVEEYCLLLGEALHNHNFRIEIRRVPWNQRGWSTSLDALRLQAQSWRGVWVIVQYTALAWSARGFPRHVRTVLRILRKSGARIAVVYHDAEPFGGSRLVDRLRRSAQLRVMRRALSLSDCGILTVPADRLNWLGKGSAAAGKFAFIPVGANLPQPLTAEDHQSLHSPPTVAVYGVTGGDAGEKEAQAIVETIRFACDKIGRLRLLVFGRHADLQEQKLREELREFPVQLEVEGLVDGKDLVKRFSASDVLLFLRGTISSRRGSAIAGIACGLPVVALRGHETASPITDAGVALVAGPLERDGIAAELGEMLAHLLSNHQLRQQLAARSRSAHERFFSWAAIASQFAEILTDEPSSDAQVPHS